MTKERNSQNTDEFFPNKNTTAPSKDCFFNYVTSQIKHHNDKVNESFKYFLTIATLLFGGLGWHLTNANKIYHIPILLTLGMVLVGVLTSALIFINTRAKHGYRQLEAKLTGRTEHRPKLISSHFSEIAMWVSIVIVSASYIFLTWKIG